MTRLLRALFTCPRGVSALEMALVLPLLLLMLGGVIELGRALHHHHVLETSVRDAVRYLSKVPDVGQAAATPCATTAGTAADTARYIAMYGTSRLMQGVPPLLPYWTEAAPQEVCITGPAPRTLTDATGQTFTTDVIRMEVTVTYEDLGLMGLIGLRDLTLRAAHEQIHIGG